MNVYVTRAIPRAALQLLEAQHQVKQWAEEDVPVPRDELLRGAAEAEGLYCLLTERVDEELLAASPRLRVVSTMSVGYDNVDVAACRRRGIAVCHTPGVLTETTADLAWALLMAAARRLPEAERYLKAGQWRTWSPLQLVGQDVYGATLGVVGMGRIGQAVARRASGFGMTVLYSGPRRHADAPGEYVELMELLRRSDFVSLHCPLNAETHHLIGERELAAMKPAAILVNTGRGPLVDERALHRALVAGQIAAAGLDVWESEPVKPGHPLLELENVVALPHIGSASVATRTKMATLAAENLLAVLDGREPPHPVPA